MKYMLVFVFALAAGTAFAQEKKDEPKKDVPWLEFRYSYDLSHPGVLDRDNIAELSLLPGGTAHFLIDNAFDLFPEKDSTEKKAGMLLAGTALLLLENAALDAGHEYGHWQAFSKVGLTDFVLVDSEDDTQDRMGSPFEVAERMWSDLTGRWAATVSAGDWAEFYSRPELTANKDAFFAAMNAGGLNQDQYTLERLSDRIIAGRGHVLDAIPWLLGVTATLRYVHEDGDIIDYVEDMGALGVETSEGRVRHAQWPKFLSGSSVAVLLGLVDFAATGDTRVGPPPSLKLGMANLYWPEFSSYLSYEEGVTVKVRLPMDARYGEHVGIRTDLMYERSIDTGAWEVGLREGIAWGWTKTHVEAYYNGSGGYWLEGGLAITPCKYVELGATYYYGAGYTFHRDLVGRTFEFLDKREDGWKLTAGVNIPF